MTDATEHHAAGGSSSPLTPGAGDATQAAKDGAPGTPSDSRPPQDASVNRVACLCPVCGADDWATELWFDEEGVDGRRCENCDSGWLCDHSECPEGDPWGTTLLEARARVWLPRYLGATR